MREVGAFEAKNKLGQLLDLVEQGEEVIITRHGKEVARLTRPRMRSGACLMLWARKVPLCQRSGDWRSPTA